MKSKEAELEIIRLASQHPKVYFLEVADLHIREIHHGVLPLLGKELLSRLYFDLAISPQSGLWIVLESDKVVGFLAGSTNVRKSYLSVISKAWPAFLHLGLRSSALDLSLVKKLLTLLIYPFQRAARTQHTIADCDHVDAEILSIAIDPIVQRRGIGHRLIKAFEQKLRQSHVQGYYKVATNRVEMKSNAFYEKVGFLPCHQVKHNDLTLQVYLKDISDAITKELTDEVPKYVQ